MICRNCKQNNLLLLTNWEGGEGMGVLGYYTQSLVGDHRKYNKKHQLSEQN